MFLIIGCAGALTLGILTIRGARKQATAQTKAGYPGPYMPLTNPYRIGAYVLITEDLNRPDMAFNGTVVSMAGGMCTVREAAHPYATVTVDKEYVFPAGTIL